MPGTCSSSIPAPPASAAYFEPLAKSIVKVLPNWQVWAVERRENFLEDQLELNLLKQGKASPTDLFNYYLGYIGESEHHQPHDNVPDSAVPFARQWGMNTEINDLRMVVKAAERRRRASPWAATPSAARSPRPTRPGTSTAGRVAGISPDSF